MGITWVAVTGAFLLASFVKGTTGMGFPLIATPMVALLVDIKTTYTLLVLPNIAMDVAQLARGDLPWDVWRRLWPLLLTTALGVFLGTRILVSVPERWIYLALAGMVFVYLASTRLRVTFRVGPVLERWLAPLIGLAGGILAGVTNVIGPLTALYLLALEFGKRDFVKAVASVFLAAKLSQLFAISHWGLYTGEIVRWSAGLTVLALLSFWVGIRTQDRVGQAEFTSILHAILLGTGLIFTYRGLR